MYYIYYRSQHVTWNMGSFHSIHPDKETAEKYADELYERNPHLDVVVCYITNDDKYETLEELIRMTRID